MRAVVSSSLRRFLVLLPLVTWVSATACGGATGDANLGGGEPDTSVDDGGGDAGDDGSFVLDADTSVPTDGSGGDGASDGSGDGASDGSGGDGASSDGSDGGDAKADGSGSDGAGDAAGDGASDGADTAPICGAPGEDCCAGGACAGGALCVSGKCGTCGGPGLICCAGTPTCSSGSVCSSGACVKCGGLGEKCCGSSACSTGFVCNTTLDSCARCGGIGEPCCAGGSCSTGGVCDGTTLRCSCGGPGQPCCAGSTCSGSALCTTAGTCSSCGGVGQPCCAGGGCLDLNVCDTGSCKAPTSCSAESECTGTGKCGGPSTCSGAVCFVCYTPPASAIGTGRAACTDSTTCASNLCDDLRGHCSAPCNNAGTLPDKACTDYLGAGFVCTEIGYTIGAASGPLGFCAKSCARNGDCPAELCQGNSNSGANRIDQTCGPADATSKGFGVACTPGSGECGTGLCLTTTTGGVTTSKCSAFCVTGADCAAPLATCGTVSFTRPGGGTQSTKACVP